MAVTQNLLNLNEYFKYTPGQKIIVNDLNILDVNDMEMINNSLMTVYDNTDVISTKPQCECGNLVGRYLIDHWCPVCGTQCKDAHDKVYPMIWLKALHPKMRFLNPAFYTMLSKMLDNNIDGLRWLSDDKYNPPVNLQPYLLHLKEILGNVRSYSNTIENIPKIINYLMTLSKFKDLNKQLNLVYLLDLYNNNPNEVFSDYLPIVNKKLFVRENTNKGVFVNLVVADAMEVVMGWIKTCSMVRINNGPVVDIESNPKLFKQYNTATIRTLSKLSEMCVSYFNKYVSQKSGILRKHVYGSRSHFTFRNVIVSRPGPHRHDQIVAPWVIGCSTFRPHLLNKLVHQRGFGYKDASMLIYRSVKKYDPLIGELLKELVNESPDPRGIPIILQRNPSLKRGSMIKGFISEFGTNPNEKAVSLSQLICKLGNGDGLIISHL